MKQLNISRLLLFMIELLGVEAGYLSRFFLYLA